MKPTKFVGLHSHTGASVYDGLGSAEEHIKFVLENGMDAWALTEHGHCNSYASAFLFAEKLKKQSTKFKFIAGCEMYVHPDLNDWRFEYERSKEQSEDALLTKTALEEQEIVTPLIASTDDDDETLEVETTNALTIEREEESKSTKYFNPVNRRHHLVVIPTTSTGLQRLFHLVSRGYSEGFYRFPRVDYAMLKEAASGGHLIAMTACIGGPMAYAALSSAQKIKFENIDSALLNDASLHKTVMSELAATYDKLIWAFGENNVYLEMQFNRLKAQGYVNRALLEFARKHSLTDQLIVAADSHYPRPELWREREIYKKLGWLKNADPNQTKLPNSVAELKAELYPKNASQIWDAYLEHKSENDFYHDDEVIAAIERSHHVAHNVVGDVQPDRTMKLPTSIVVPAGMTADTRLFELCREGMDERSFTGNSVYEERLTKELDVIRDKKFAEYFLTLREIIHVAQSAMLVGPGRGSGAGSLVTYLLKITDVDPIKYDLLFERFLNKYREEAPDVDTDVSNRAKLIELLKERFGAENVVPISNYNTFKLKTLIKDVAKFYGVPFEEANNATKTVEAEVRKATLKHGDDKNLFVLKFEDAMQHSPSFKSFIDAHPQVAGPIATLFKQQRSLGRHAGGVIVCDRIAERMPLIASKGELQTPWAEGVNVKELDQFGWIKFDLLGLDTLRIVEKTIELIITSERKARGWYEIDTDIGSFYAHGDAVAITSNRGNVFVRDLVEGDDVSDLML